MKKIFAVATVLLISWIFLVACTSLSEKAHTPAPPPQGENATWILQVMDIKKYTEPKEFSCTDCSQDTSQAGLSLQDGYSFLNVTVKVINKSNEVQNVPDVRIGVLLNSLVYGCGGVTVAGTDFCLPSGMTRGGKNYVNYGLGSGNFQETLGFSPNSPDGEIVEFVFIVNKRDKSTKFYFDGLPAINIKKMKP